MLMVRQSGRRAIPKTRGRRQARNGHLGGYRFWQIVNDKGRSRQQSQVLLIAALQFSAYTAHSRRAARRRSMLAITPFYRSQSVLSQMLSSCRLLVGQQRCKKYCLPRSSCRIIIAADHAEYSLFLPDRDKLSAVKNTVRATVVNGSPTSPNFWNTPVAPVRLLRVTYSPIPLSLSSRINPVSNSLSLSGITCLVSLPAPRRSK